MNHQIKILFFDIENSPSLGWVWGKWEQNVLDFQQQTYMLSFSYRWAHEKKTHVLGLPDFKTYRKNPTDDKELVKVLWDLFNKADVIVAHNGNSFDIKMSHARFLLHGLPPPEPSKSIDTKLVAKKYFRFNSNSLNDLAKLLGLGGKHDTGGIKLWFDCMNGDMKAWKKMKDYNRQDTVLLYQVYEKLKGWMNNHPNVNLYSDEEGKCPICGGNHLQKRGFSFSKAGKYQRYQCQDCAGWSRDRKIIKLKTDITQ